MNTVLTYVLGALAVLGVILALQTINRTREDASLQVQAIGINQNYIRLQGALTEATAYNQKNPSPELARILKSAE